MLQKRVEFYNDEHQLLSGILRIPDEEGAYPAVVICHDFRENKDREFIIELANAISVAGFAALRFDFIHHGESHGSPEHITLHQEIRDVDDAIDFLNTIPQVDKNRIACIGHGFGADIIFLSAEKDSRIKAVVSVGARSRLDELLRSYFSEHEVKETIERGFIVLPDLTTLNRHFIDDMMRYDIIESVQKLKCPLLILHGTDDKRSPFQDARELFNHAGGKKTLDIVEGADHNFTGPSHRKYMLGVVTGWLKANLK